MKSIDLHPDVHVDCCGGHPRLESLNCDHIIIIIKPVQTVTHTVRLNVPAVVQQGAQICVKANVGHKIRKKVLGLEFLLQLEMKSGV